MTNTKSGSFQQTSRLTLITSHLGYSTRDKVVVCRDLGPDIMPFLYKYQDRLEIVVWPENSACDRTWLLKNVVGAVGVIVMLSDKVNAELLDAAGPQLRVVSTMSVGYEHASLPDLAERRVRFGYTPDVLTDAVADLSVMLALMAGRNVNETMSLVKSGQWPSFTWSPFAFCGPQISTLGSSDTSTRTIGFLGFGRIAQATLKRLVPFGITRCIYVGNPASSHISEPTLVHGIPTNFVQLSTLASESDVLFILAPATPSTNHIISSSFLRQMKSTAVLVNTSRGTLVDSPALAHALEEKWIWGAGIDVVEGEPNVSEKHALVKCERCVVLPHIASATMETRRGMAKLAVDNLLGGLEINDVMPAELDVGKK